MLTSNTTTVEAVGSIFRVELVIHKWHQLLLLSRAPVAAWVGTIFDANRGGKKALSLKPSGDKNARRVPYRGRARGAYYWYVAPDLSREREKIKANMINGMEVSLNIYRTTGSGRGRDSFPRSLRWATTR